MTTLSPDDVFIAVMGMTGVGKTKFIADCTGQPVLDHPSLESCTTGLTMHTMPYPTLTNRICLIDTPGFDDTYRSDAEVLQEVAFWLIKSYEMGIRLSGIVYLHRINDTRIGGSALRALKIFKEICGPESLHGVTMATTFWDKVDDFDKARQTEKELHSNPHFWKEFVDGKCTVKALTAGKTSALELVSAIAHSDKRLTLKMQRQLVDEKLLVQQTDAGRIVQELWVEEKGALHAQLQQTRQDLSAAMAANEQKRQEELHQHYDSVSRSIIHRNSAIKDLEKPTNEITQFWGERAHEDLVMMTRIAEETRKQLDEAKALRERAQADGVEYAKFQQEVEKLYKQQEAADRRKNIQIANYSLKISGASLGTALFSAVGTALSAGAAVAPILGALACNVM